MPDLADAAVIIMIHLFLPLVKSGLDIGDLFVAGEWRLTVRLFSFRIRFRPWIWSVSMLSRPQRRV